MSTFYDEKVGLVASIVAVIRAMQMLKELCFSDLRSIHLRFPRELVDGVRDVMDPDSFRALLAGAAGVTSFELRVHVEVFLHVDQRLGIGILGGGQLVACMRRDLPMEVGHVVYLHKDMKGPCILRRKGERESKSAYMLHGLCFRSSLRPDNFQAHANEVERISIV